MIQTNTPFLQPDLMEVLRMFGMQQQPLTHAMHCEDNRFFNDVTYQGQTSSFCDEAQTQTEVEFKRYARRFAKLAVYCVLKAATGQTFPWGALTGIRPTKLAYMEQEHGRDFAALFRHMDVTEPNISLTQTVLDNQKAVYTNQGGQDLFVSLPFCPTKCEYCSFITAPIKNTQKYLEDYVSCLEREIFSIAPLLTNLRSVYIGGGTPFVLSVAHLERVFQALQKVLPKQVEYTVEAGRPDTFTDEKLALCAKYGVTRICVNPQSFSNETLKAIGRKHTEEDVYAAYQMARKYNFEINCDLIVGLADEGVEDVRASVQKAVDMGFENITVHSLCLKVGARLKEEVDVLHVAEIDHMLAATRQILSDSGYVPYYLYRQKYQAGGGENIGWTKQGKVCVYNIDTMEEICDNVAVGAGSVCKKVYLGSDGKIERFGAPKDIKTYIEKIDEIIQNRLDFYTK